jgi:recombinational DNA repair protein RecR
MHSKRKLAELQQTQRQAQSLRESGRQIARRKPYDCQRCGTRQARRGCKLCRVCVSLDKEEQRQRLVIWQGCPEFIRGTNRIRWAMEFRELYFWLIGNLNIKEGNVPCHDGPRELYVSGWSNGEDVKEARCVDGIQLHWVFDNDRLDSDTLGNSRHRLSRSGDRQGGGEHCQPVCL